MAKLRAKTARHLDDEQREQVESLEDGVLESVVNPEENKKTDGVAIGDSFNKTKRVTIKISEKDMNAIQNKAMEESVSYQDLIAAVLHKFANGNLTESE